MVDKAINVFISYSHDNDEHKKWVRELSEKLVNNGVDVILDQWDLSLGGDLPSFMESISDSSRVLVVCTDNYIEKSNKNLGGVGYEKSILTAELLANQDTKKFIPIVRNVTSPTKTPICLSGKLYIDFSNDSQYERLFSQLLHDIYEVPLHPKPPLGKSPFEKESLETSSQVKIAPIVHNSPSKIQLSSSACNLLKEASLDSDGLVLCADTIGQTIIQTNGNNLITSNEKREVAKWKSAFEELVDKKILKARKAGGNVYELTNLGYEIADELKP